MRKWFLINIACYRQQPLPLSCGENS
jgi:hypothetical protein